MTKISIVTLVIRMKIVRCCDGDDDNDDSDNDDDAIAAMMMVVVVEAMHGLDQDGADNAAGSG